MTVVMISHMFLNLKGREGHGSRSSIYTKRLDPVGTVISFGNRVAGRKDMSSTLVGNLGNDLMHLSILGRRSANEKGGK